jgi:ADP-ribose pyrophosphatase
MAHEERTGARFPIDDMAAADDLPRIIPGDAGRGEVELLAEQLVWENKAVRVYNDQVRFPATRDGGHVEGAVFRVADPPGKANGVIVAPIDGDGKVVLVRQFRHPVRLWMMELPRGRRDAGERPEDAAARELREEIGFEADSLHALGRVSPDSGQLSTVPICSPRADESRGRRVGRARRRSTARCACSTTSCARRATVVRSSMATRSPPCFGSRRTCMAARFASTEAPAPPIGLSAHGVAKGHGSGAPRSRIQRGEMTMEERSSDNRSASSPGSGSSAPFRRSGSGSEYEPEGNWAAERGGNAPAGDGGFGPEGDYAGRGGAPNADVVGEVNGDESGLIREAQSEGRPRPGRRFAGGSAVDEPDADRSGRGESGR